MYICFNINNTGVTVLCLFSYASNMSFNSSTKIAGFTDRRVNLMNEILAGMIVVKLHCWEHHFKTIVSAIRKLVITLILCYRDTKVINVL